jgi:hypothetical protein
MGDSGNSSDEASSQMEMVACVSIHTNSDRSNRTIECMEADARVIVPQSYNPAADDVYDNDGKGKKESKQPFDEIETDNIIKENLSERLGDSETESTSSLATDEGYTGMQVIDGTKEDKASVFVEA